MLRSDDDDRLSNVLVITGDTRISQTEASVDSIHSSASDDVTVVRPSTMPTANSSLPPALPFRSKVERRRCVFPKARAPSPAAADVTEGMAPPIPPRLPPRLSHSSDYNQRLPRRPVHVPGSPLVLLLSAANDSDLSGAELLQSRPPPPPRGLSSADGMTHCPPPPPSVAHQRFPKSSREVSSSAAPEDVDLVWWPSRDRPPDAHQLHQLSHWPIITYADDHRPMSGSRQMNDYVDSPIALHSNAQTANNSDGLLEVVAVDSEASDVSSSDRRPAPPSLPPSLPASTKVKPGVRQRTAPPQCQQRVTCARCGKCRCKQCTVARPLPRCWAGQCECSAQSAVDRCTCMCCARALFYHCRTTEDEDFSDDPCACTEQSGCCRRWTLLALLSLCLPCLCLYCPLAGAVRLCTACYNRRKNSRGCCCCDDERCRTDASKGLLLLVESESSSS